MRLIHEAKVKILNWDIATNNCSSIASKPPSFWVIFPFHIPIPLRVVQGRGGNETSLRYSSFLNSVSLVFILPLSAITSVLTTPQPQPPAPWSSPGYHTMSVSGLSHSCFLCARVFLCPSSLQPGKPTSTPWTEGELTSLPSMYPTQRRSPFRPSGLTCHRDFIDHPPCFQLLSHLSFWSPLFQNSPNFHLSEHYWEWGEAGRSLLFHDTKCTIKAISTAFTPEKTPCPSFVQEFFSFFKIF